MRPMTRILCPVDLSDISRHAIDHATLLASWWRARITALHVWNPIRIPSTDFSLAGMPMPPPMTDEDVADLRSKSRRSFSPPGYGPMM